MSPLKGKTPRALIYTMVALVVITVLITQRYYSGENRKADPRVVPARELYESYNSLAVKNDFQGVIRLLDTIESIYRQYPHYYLSFETGVLENNRAAVYLTLALNYDSISSPYHYLGQDSLVSLGEAAVRNSITIYETWEGRYTEKTDRELLETISETFYEGLSNRDEADIYLQTRLKEIKTALDETPRRLSVSYTNLGIVSRYREDYESAANYYRRAIELWEDNLTAENNLNILLGKPPRKRNFIQKMFPKPKD